ncbi:MAG TPA: TIGR01777 family oxidoreductase [Thermoanaerobaculia bacterium]|nr:TIGR01777 family oxidoreductase [Thermoanaerobaculia bacterium]
MNVIVAGGSGFIGTALVRALLARGEDVGVLSRRPMEVREGRGIGWDAVGEAVSNADAIINLAGENVGAGRWTEARKRRILQSRVETTHTLVEALRAAPARKRTFVCASAVGYFGPRGDEILDESASSGAGFLAEVVRQWEAAAREGEPFARVVITRFGVVLGPGGALAKMMLPFRFGVGGRVGSGRQWMSWIDRDDVVRFVLWALDNEDARGVYNATAPEPVRNREFTRALGRAMHRPAFMPAPAFALRILFGRMAEEILLGGQRVVPARAAREGFVFEYPNLDRALAHALKSP